MGIHSAEAIILRRYPFRETSVTLTCLTDQFGKLKGLVKGLRAQPNRYRSAMEPMTINRIVFYDTRNSQLHLITQCELVSSLTGLQTDLETMRLAALCMELVDHVVPLEDPQPVIYQLLKQALERLALGEHAALVRTHFIVRLLRLAGFQPQADMCTGCNIVVRAEGFWSAQHGGLLCASCLHQDPHAEAAGSGMLDALNLLAHADCPPALDTALVPLLHRRLNEFLRWRLDRPLKTLVG